jgi:hypothetical protein
MEDTMIRESFRKFFSSWKYLGEVKSLRSTYYVFELEECFAVVRPDSRLKDSYNIVFLTKNIVNSIYELYCNERSLTTKKILGDRKMDAFFPNVDLKTRQLLILQSLLVIVSQGKAKVRRKGRTLSFSFLS